MSGAARPRRHPRRVTSVDVAREADVSQATVSRAFTTPEAVSQAARDRIYAAAERLGYAPNAIARSLSSNRTRIIGVVVPAASEYYEHALSLFSRRLAPLDHQLLLFEYEYGTNIDHVLRAVRSYQVDALVISAMIIAPAQAASLQAAGIPVVMFNYRSDDASLPSVSVDGEAGMRRLAQHLVETGHRSVAYVGGVRSSSADQIRYRGAVETLAGYGVPCRYVEGGAFTYGAGAAAASKIIESDVTIDAVMAASDSIAFGVIDGLRTAGIAVPDQVSVTGFDGLAQAAWKAYDLTTVEQPMEELVRLTVELAMQQVTNSGEAGSTVVPGVLRLRGTVSDRTRRGEQ